MDFVQHQITTILKLQDITPTEALSQEEDALIKRAVGEWNDDNAFGDDDVERVKTLFRRVFGVECPLKGSTAEDALLLEETAEDDLVRLYAVQVKDAGELRWVRWEAHGDYKCLVEMPLAQILFFMTMSEAMHYTREEEEEESDESDSE
jgi:hypothetical protein